MKGFHRVFALLVVLSLVLAACGGGGKSTESPKPSDKKAADSAAVGSNANEVATAQPKEMMKARFAVGGAGSIIYLPLAIAHHKGFFKEEGIDSEILDVKGGTQVIQALTSGEVDWGSAALEHTVKSQSQGVDLVMLGLYARYPSITLVVSTDLKDKVKSVQDLKGMKVGVTSLGSATHKALLSLLAKYDMKPSDVEVVGVGTADAVEAIKSNKVQAAFTLDPFTTDLIASGKAWSIWDLRTQKDTEALYGEKQMPFVGMVTRREVVEKNPEMAQRIVNAIVKANKYITTSMPEEVAAALPAELKGVSEALYVASLKGNLETFPPDAIASEAGVELVIKSLRAEKAIPENFELKPSTVFDPTFAKKAS